MNVQIISTVEECFFTEAEFYNTLIETTYTLGNEKETISLPKVTASPECGIEPVIKNVAIVDVSLPDGFTREQLIDHTDKKIIIKEQINLVLLKQQASFKVTAETEEGLPLTLDLEILYTSDGPWFEKAADVPDITCSPEDQGWSF